MTQQFTLKPIIKDMLEHAGIEGVYDFAPSAKDCACPIVITNETYEQSDLLEDCEYGTVKLEIIAVRETSDEAITTISKVIHALHSAEWDSYGYSKISIREMNVAGLPESIGTDSSGRKKLKSNICVKVAIG